MFFCSLIFPLPSPQLILSLVASFSFRSLIHNFFGYRFLSTTQPAHPPKTKLCFGIPKPMFPAPSPAFCSLTCSTVSVFQLLMVAISARRPSVCPSVRPSVRTLCCHAPACTSPHRRCRVEFFPLSDKLCLSEKFNEVRALQLHFGPPSVPSRLVPFSSTSGRCGASCQFCHIYAIDIFTVNTPTNELTSPALSSLFSRLHLFIELIC